LVGWECPIDDSHIIEVEFFFAVDPQRSVVGVVEGLHEVVFFVEALLVG
jgi:hypothetical protein